jgi:hypothetical protein
MPASNLRSNDWQSLLDRPHPPKCCRLRSITVYARENVVIRRRGLPGRFVSLQGGGSLIFHPKARTVFRLTLASVIEPRSALRCSSRRDAGRRRQIHQDGFLIGSIRRGEIQNRPSGRLVPALSRELSKELPGYRLTVTFERIPSNKPSIHYLSQGDERIAYEEPNVLSFTYQ